MVKRKWRQFQVRTEAGRVELTHNCCSKNGVSCGSIVISREGGRYCLNLLKSDKEG